MADNQPTAGQTLAVLLGASEYEHAPKLAQGTAFENSSWEFKNYLINTMGVPRENVASFFDDKRSANDQLQDVGAFLERRAAALERAGTQACDLIIHYVGHGLFSGSNHDYYLAICSTKERKEGITSIRFGDLANAIRDPAMLLRKYLILDCCFSAAAVDQFQSAPLSVVREKVREVLPDDSPTRGTSLLCSASKEDPSLAPKGLKYTMFSDSLLSVLKEGHERYETRLSLIDLGDLVRKRINETYKDDGVRPEVHSPDQRKGDVARFQLFPNPAHLQAFEKPVEAERARRAQEERERAKAERHSIEAEEESRKQQAHAVRRAQEEQQRKARELAKASGKKRKRQAKMVRVAIVVGLASLAIYLWYRPGQPRIQEHRFPHWQQQNSGTTKRLHSIFGTQDGWHLWTVGDKGIILQSDDAGVTWRDRTSGTATKQHSIFGTQDLRHLWTVGDKGTMLQSDDGGATWQARISGTTNELHSVFGAQDSMHLWTVGDKGTILQSDDDGATWRARVSGTTDNLNSIFGAAHGEHLWAVGDKGIILQSDDLGSTWQVRTSGTIQKLQSIFGAMPVSNLWVVGQKGTMLRSEDHGATWQTRISGTTEALNSVLGTSDGSHLWAVGDKTTILLSDNGGATWRVGATWEAGWATNNLLSIFGTPDGKRLWAVGDSGTILQFDASNQ